MTRVVGIDLSLTSTGVAVIDDDDLGSPNLVRITSTGKATATLAERQQRLSNIATRVAAVVGDADLVVIEGPSFGHQRQGGQHDRAGLWWLVVDHLLDGPPIPVAEVPPSIRAKYATGAGNAPKDAVLAAVVRRYPQSTVTGNDTADALVLAAMGARHLGQPIDQLPTTHLQAMTKVRWPDPAPPRPPAPADGTTPPQPIPGQLTIGDDD